MQMYITIYMYDILTGVPSVARDDEWRNLTAFFALDNERDCIICGNVSL